MTFADLGLPAPLLAAVTRKGYTTPSPIQREAIPHVLEGADLMAAAQTGTGKTAAFTLPILSRLAGGARASAGAVRALIVAPTRELAAQVHQSVEDYGKGLSLSSTVVFGGVKINPQIARLRRGCDILVATPGRLLDLQNQRAVDLGRLEILVLDEADRMLDMGFIHDIRRIVALLPAGRQTLMFSATFSNQIRSLAAGFLRNPRQVDVAPPNSTAERVAQFVHPVDKGRKPELLSHLVRSQNWHQVLVFTRTKHGANKLARRLEGDGIRAEAIHGNKSQGARTRALDGFKRGRVQALVATDIAARGLDIAQLPQVVNFDLPNVAEDYVHRIGRTGRAGAEGRSYSLVSADEAAQLAGIERLIRLRLPREVVSGFEPQEPLREGASPGSGPRRRGRAAGSGARGQQQRSGAGDRSRKGAAATSERPIGGRSRPARSDGGRRRSRA